MGPSGAGKTRLASEWANKSHALRNWDRRFLHKEDRSEPEKWSNWIPDKPTLLIIDYMYGFEAVIQKLMHHRLEPDVPKIRLLLIDHVFSEPLHSDKRWGFSGDGSSLNRNEKYFFCTKPLDLRHTENQEEIIKSVIAHRSGLDKKSDQVDIAHKYLQETQGAYHPLFAALVGDAMKPDTPDKNFTQWNRHQLIDYYLSGDRLPWKDGNVGRWASHFIAVATARRCMNYRDLVRAAGNCTSSPEHFDEVKEICQKVVTDNNTEILKPFEPDILGENFFLKFLQFIENSPKYQNEFRQIFMVGNENTQTEDAIEFIAFIQRLTRNLLNDDQILEETRALWDTLFDFMNPADFKDSEPIMWAVTAGLIDIIDAIKVQFPEKEVIAFLNKAEPSIFYRVNNESFLEASVLYSMRHFELTYRSTKIVPKLPQELARLFDEFIKNIINWKTPLMMASFYGFNKMVHALIDYGVITEAKLTGGQNVLMVASSMGHTRVVQCLLNNTNISVNAIDRYNRTALIWACFYGHIQTVKLLINKEADTDVADIEGCTSLILASRNGHIKVVNLLLEKKAQTLLNIADKMGCTALVWASRNGHINIVSLLLEKEAKIDITDKKGCTALIWASRNGNTNIVRLLLKKEAKIDAADIGGRTALIWASMNNHIDLVKLLLEENVNINAADIYGHSALMWASSNNHIQMIELLIAQEEQIIDATDKKGCTALMWASDTNHIEAATTLLNQGANINHVDEGKRTILMGASFNGHIEIIRLLLLNNEIKVDAIDNEGRTALMWACLAKQNQEIHIEVVKLLLWKKSRPNVVDNYGQTALSIAKVNGHTEIAQLLIDNGAQD